MKLRYACDEQPEDHVTIELFNDGEMLIILNERGQDCECVLSVPDIRHMAMHALVNTINPRATNGEREIMITKLRLLFQ